MVLARVEARRLKNTVRRDGNGLDGLLQFATGVTPQVHTGFEIVAPRHR